MKRVSKSLDETEKIAKEFLGGLHTHIIGLVGDLGAGKTAFVQAIAKLSGIKPVVTSPTFVIMKIYDFFHERFDKLIHIDSYRLQSGEELSKLNFAELAADQKNLILIEWPENVESALPKNLTKVYFKSIDENTREIEF